MWAKLNSDEDTIEEIISNPKQNASGWDKPP